MLSTLLSGIPRRTSKQSPGRRATSPVKRTAVVTPLGEGAAGAPRRNSRDASINISHSVLYGCCSFQSRCVTLDLLFVLGLHPQLKPHEAREPAELSESLHQFRFWFLHCSSPRLVMAGIIPQ